jgi:ribosomal protein L35AE/L33A
LAAETEALGENSPPSHHKYYVIKPETESTASLEITEIFVLKVICLYKPLHGNVITGLMISTHGVKEGITYITTLQHAGHK